MSIKSVIIYCVESQYTQEYIANVFWRQHIAKVSSITLIPYLKNGSIYNIAYITIDEWCDRESAYNLIQRLNDPSKEARIIHYEDKWWPVEINTHNNGDIYLGAYTVSFASDYFMKEVEDVATAPYSYDEEELSLRIELPIQGLENDCYPPEEVDIQINKSWEKLQRVFRTEPYDEWANALSHFESEMRIHHSVKNSQNVTLREGQKPCWSITAPKADINGIKLIENPKMTCINML
jgi:hypothetical protein